MTAKKADLQQEDQQLDKRSNDTSLQSVKSIEDLQARHRDAQSIHTDAERQRAGDKPAVDRQIAQAERHQQEATEAARKILTSREHQISLMEGQNAPRDEINRVKTEFNKTTISSITLAGLAGKQSRETSRVQSLAVRERGLKQHRAGQVAKRPIFSIKYEGLIVGETSTHYIQAVREAGEHAHYQHRKQSFGRNADLKVGDNVSIKHMSKNTAIAVKLKPMGMNTPADGLDCGLKLGEK